MSFFNVAAMDIELAADGTIYVSGGWSRVQRIAPDGRIYTFAGSSTVFFPRLNINGTSGDEGDGGLATDAEFFSPGGLALGRDGTLFIVDFTFDRVRRVGADGIITAVAGRRHPNEDPNVTFALEGDEGPAAAATFNQPVSIAFAPDGTLYIADEGNNRIRKMTPPLPGLSEVGDTVIASADGSELYVFNASGRHQRTIDALAKDDQGSPVVIWDFDYDDPETGFLTAVTDRDGNVTTFERGVAGGDLVITGPFGQQTTITLDANGYVQSIANFACAPVFQRTASVLSWKFVALVGEQLAPVPRRDDEGIFAIFQGGATLAWAPRAVEYCDESLTQDTSGGPPAAALR